LASPAFVAKANGGGSAAANVTVAVPTGTLDNHMMVYVLSKDDTGAVTWPGGWSILIEMTQNSCYLGIGYKRAASEPANYTWNFSSIWRDSCIVTYSGVSTAATNPFDPDAAPTPTTGSSAPGSITSPSITTATIETTLLAIYHHVAISGWGGQPSGWTGRQGSAGGGVNDEECIDDQTQASAGTFSGANQSFGSSIGGWKAVTIALQSQPDDQHYFPPPAFPGVFNLDARRMI